MRSFRSKPVGWQHDNYRHYLAAKYGSASKRYMAFSYTPKTGLGSAVASGFENLDYYRAYGDVGRAKRLALTQRDLKARQEIEKQMMRRPVMELPKLGQENWASLTDSEKLKALRAEYDKKKAPTAAEWRARVKEVGFREAQFEARRQDEERQRKIAEESGAAATELATERMRAEFKQQKLLDEMKKYAERQSGKSERPKRTPEEARQAQKDAVNAEIDAANAGIKTTDELDREQRVERAAARKREQDRSPEERRAETITKARERLAAKARERLAAKAKEQPEKVAINKATGIKSAKEREASKVARQKLSAPPGAKPIPNSSMVMWGGEAVRPEFAWEEYNKRTRPISVDKPQIKVQKRPKWLGNKPAVDRSEYKKHDVDEHDVDDDFMNQINGAKGDS